MSDTRSRLTCRSAAPHVLRLKRACPRGRVWLLAALALAGPYLLWFLLRP
jgi:hypothetical protein